MNSAVRDGDSTIQVDPLQSALIMIDFFTRPPARKTKLSFDWMPSLIAQMADAEHLAGKARQP